MKISVCLIKIVGRCSHDPVFTYNYFVTNSENFDNSCFENFMPTSATHRCAGHFVKIFSKIEHGKIKDGGSVDLFG